MTGTATPPASTVGEGSILSERTDGQSLRGEIKKLLQNWKDYQAGVETGREVSSPENEPANGAMEQLSLAFHKAEGDHQVVEVQETEAGPELTTPPNESPRQLIQELATHVYRQAIRHKDAQKLFEVAVVEAVDVLGVWDVDTLQISEGLALSYRAVGRLDESVTIYDQTLERREPDLGSGNDDTLRVAANLAISLVHRGEYYSAIAEVERALAACNERSAVDITWCTSLLEDLQRMRDDKFAQLVLWHQYSLAKMPCGRIPSQPEPASGDRSANEVLSEAEKAEKRTAERPLPSSPGSRTLFDEHGARSIQQAAWYQGDGTEYERYTIDFTRVGDETLPPIELLDPLGVYSRFLDVMNDDYGVNVNLMDRHGYNALHSAASGGDFNRVRLLLSREDVEPDMPKRETGETPMMLAISGKHPDAVELLLQHPGVNPDACDLGSRTPLIIAAYWNQLETAQSLLATRRVDVNHVSNGNEWTPDTALTAAARCGNGEMVRLLLDTGARDNVSTKQSALMASLNNNINPGITALLLERASPNVSFRTPKGETALHRAKNPETCRNLLDLGATTIINATNTSGCTALINASVETTKVLLHYGADPSIRDKEGNTPLLKAVWNSDEKKMRLLLERGSAAEVDAANVWGETPLTVAFQRGKEECTAMLLRAGARADLEALGKLDGKCYREGRMAFAYPRVRTREEMLEFVRGLIEEQVHEKKTASASVVRPPVLPSRL